MKNELIKVMNKKRDMRMFALTAKDVVATACEIHETWSSSSVALGRLMLGTILLGANQKGNDKISVIMRGNGSGGQIVAESNACGEVKGYIQNPHVDMRKTSTGEVIISQATGNQGTFTVIKDLGLKTPYQGQIPFVTGEIGEEFTYYLTNSEQIPSSVGLNVSLDAEDRVQFAGGFMVQVMPDACEESIREVEKNIQQMPAISEILAENELAEELVKAVFGEGNYDILEKMNLSWQCDCSKERFTKGIATLGKVAIQAMIDEDHGCETVCHYCQTKYLFSEMELKEIVKGV